MVAKLGGVWLLSFSVMTVHMMMYADKYDDGDDDDDDH